MMPTVVAGVASMIIAAQNATAALGIFPGTASVILCSGAVCGPVSPPGDRVPSPWGRTARKRQWAPVLVPLSVLSLPLWVRP